MRSKLIIYVDCEVEITMNNTVETKKCIGIIFRILLVSVANKAVIKFYFVI